MALLKEDGSLDIQRINKLPIIEWMNLMGELTDEQYEEYTKSPLYESREHLNIVEENLTWDEMEKAGFIEVSEAINKLKKEFGFK